MGIRQRIAVAILSLSAAGFATWQANEGFTATAVIPTKGDVPTIGHGSTHYADGRPVKMGDTITRADAATLAHDLIAIDERTFAATLPGVSMTQGEYDVYLDFVGQYGIGTWRASSMRADLIAGQPAKACGDLLKYRFAAGYDCSTPGNKRCAGVWTRQQSRAAKCKGAL